MSANVLHQFDQIILRHRQIFFAAPCLKPAYTDLDLAWDLSVPSAHVPIYKCDLCVDMSVHILFPCCMFDR